MTNHLTTSTLTKNLFNHFCHYRCSSISLNFAFNLTAFASDLDAAISNFSFCFSIALILLRRPRINSIEWQHISLSIQSQYPQLPTSCEQTAYLLSRFLSIHEIIIFVTLPQGQIGSGGLQYLDIFACFVAQFSAFPLQLICWDLLAIRVRKREEDEIVHFLLVSMQTTDLSLKHTVIRAIWLFDCKIK